MWSFLTRTPAFVFFAFIANVFIFYFIMQLVTNENFRARSFDSVNLVDFIRLKEEITPPDEIKPEQELEEPPPPDEVPPPPDVPQPEISKPDVSQLDVQIPNLDIPLNIEGTPFIGDFAKSAPNTSDAVSMQASRGILTDLKPTLKVQPEYPRRALRSGIEGVVVVEFTITKDGKVKDPVIIKSPSDIFNRAVLKVITRWQFNPETENGKPIEVRARQNVKFKLQK